jgi:hypothetical protein
MPLDLPETSFAEIAVALTQVKAREDYSVRALEAFVAGNPRAPLFQSVVDARQVARAVAEVAKLFRQLAPFEDDARSLLAVLVATQERERIAAAEPPAKRESAS